MIDIKIKILTNNMAVIIYFQNLLFCLIKLLRMRKIIILMLIILGFASCGEKSSTNNDEVFVIENVTVSPTTLTFKFRGVEKTRTYSLLACQDEEGKYPSYETGEVVKISENRVSHVELCNDYEFDLCMIIALIFGGIIGFFIASDIYS